MARVLGGLISGLTPYSFGLANAGHLNKIFAMGYAPWVFACFLLFMKNKSLKSLCVLSLVTALQLWANHPQIVYYTWMIIGFYYVWKIIIEFKNQSLSSKTIAHQTGGIFVSILVAFLIVSDPYKEVYTFQQHSNRGAKSVLDKTNETSSGTDWQYATQWSLSVFLRLAKFFIKRFKICGILGIHAIYPVNALFRFNCFDTCCSWSFIEKT